MTETVFEIVGSGPVWIFEHDGEESSTYPSARAAFEAAADAAAAAVRDGQDVTLRLSRTADPGESAVADAPAGSDRGQPGLQRPETSPISGRSARITSGRMSA